MKTLKTKWIAIIGGTGALCILCCTIPIMGFLGLGTLEAFFCESKIMQSLGYFTLGAAISTLILKKLQQKTNAMSCSIECGCKIK